MLAQNARRYPHECALIELDPARGRRSAVTWRQFDEHANRIASALMERGVTRGDRVIHLMRNSISWLEVYFGIIRTGAWAVPLNFRFTSRDIRFCIDTAQPKAVIFGPEFTERIEAACRGLSATPRLFFAGDGPLPGTESLAGAAAAAPSTPPGVPLADEDVCGLYFTSGTTGDPKPIMLTHGNMEFTARTEQHHHQQQHDDNFVLIPPLYHTGAKMHWFGNLLVGARATILTGVSPHSIFQAVHQEGGTIVWLLVPWALDILGALDRGELRPGDYDLSRWRLMHIGAQPVPPSLVRRWKEYFPQMQYDTNYGLSEACGPGCVHLGVENEHKVGSIGRAGAGWQVRIVDEAGNDVPPGVNGELLVRGGGVMKGYYRNPARTAEAIRDGWLYTGDIARFDEDGFIWLTDRKKDVIIAGGENIYPVEIEDVLQECPGVHDAAVIGLADERLGEVPAAVIQPAPGAALTEAEVLAFCEAQLPRYKRPRRVFFGEVPRNPTGKIEKPKLRQRYRG